MYVLQDLLCFWFYFQARSIMLGSCSIDVVERGVFLYPPLAYNLCILSSSILCFLNIQVLTFLCFSIPHSVINQTIYSRNLVNYKGYGPRPTLKISEVLFHVSEFEFRDAIFGRTECVEWKKFRTSFSSKWRGTISLC